MTAHPTDSQPPPRAKGAAPQAREADRGETYDVSIIGAGPAGLAAAIAAKKSGLRYRVVEKGALVNSLLHYPVHMVFFTTPELMEIGGLPFVSPNEKPSRQEALRYYRRVTDAFELEIAFDERVTRIVAEAPPGPE